MECVGYTVKVDGQLLKYALNTDFYHYTHTDKLAGWSGWSKPRSQAGLEYSFKSIFFEFHVFI